MMFVGGMNVGAFAEMIYEDLKRGKRFDYEVWRKKWGMTRLQFAACLLWLYAKGLVY